MVVIQFSRLGRGKGQTLKPEYCVYLVKLNQPD